MLCPPVRQDSHALFWVESPAVAERNELGSRCFPFTRFDNTLNAAAHKNLEKLRIHPPKNDHQLPHYRLYRQAQGRP